ncbi:MAG: F0F1 ATP synthase subunit A [Oscillospiraceae bacterium]|nr:F0F1 ATP synthase subunit A [Oscillospiraceae bacterium]
MSLNVTGPFIYFTIPIFGGIPITQTTISSLIVTVGLIIAALSMGKNLKKRPDGKQVLLEKGVMMMHNMVVDTMGAHNARWTPFIITLFVSSICGSLIGMTGFLRSTTADLSTTLTWAVMVSVIIWYQSIKTNGFLGWLKGFTEPLAVMTPMNVVSEIAQPVSLAFRHFGNVAGGGVITSILYTALAGLSSALLGLIASSGVAVSIVLLAAGAGLLVLGLKKKKLGLKILGIICAVLGVLGMLQVFGVVSDVPIFQFGIPAVLSLYFDLFSGFIQALVFSLLTMVYISGACPPPEEAVQP